MDCSGLMEKGCYPTTRVTIAYHRVFSPHDWTEDVCDARAARYSVRRWLPDRRLRNP